MQFWFHGIDAEVIVTGQGGTAGISALLANDVQIVNSAGDVLVAAALRGGDTVMIAGVVNKGLQRLATKPEIKTPADLKGKRIGVTRIGAVSHSVLLMMLQQWKMSPSDVQVMDVQLPGIDGLELTRRLKADPATHDIKILGLTAYAMKGDREKILAAGCDGYIAKPIDTRALPGLLEHYFER